MMKKIVLFLVVLAFLVVPVSAATPKEDAERAIRDYFHQRELLLTNQADTIPIAPGITQEELKHRSCLAESSIVFIESQITITDLWVEELYGSATVIETVQYRKDGAVATVQISHVVGLHRRGESITIGSDGYFDSLSAFASLSYVPDDIPETTTATTTATSASTSTAPVVTQPEPPPAYGWLFLAVGVLICAAIGVILVVILKKKT